MNWKLGAISLESRGSSPSSKHLKLPISKEAYHYKYVIQLYTNGNVLLHCQPNKYRPTAVMAAARKTTPRSDRC